MTTELGRRVRAARRERGWSLREAERQTGIHNAHLAQIETGTITRPSTALLWELHTGFGIDYGEMLRLSGHVTEQEAGSTDQRLQRAGVMMRQIEKLTYEEQQQLLDYIEELRGRRSE